MSWNRWLRVEILCEFALYYRGYLDEHDRQRQLAHWESIVGRLEQLMPDDRVVIGSKCIDCGREMALPISGRPHDRCPECEQRHSLEYQARYRLTHKRTHAQQALAWYHRAKRPKTRVCSCGASYEIPIKRGHVPRECPECRARRAA